MVNCESQVTMFGPMWGPGCIMKARK